MIHQEKNHMIKATDCPLDKSLYVYDQPIIHQSNLNKKTDQRPYENISLNQKSTTHQVSNISLITGDAENSNDFDKYQSCTEKNQSSNSKYATDNQTSLYGCNINDMSSDLPLNHLYAASETVIDLSTSHNDTNDPSIAINRHQVNRNSYHTDNSFTNNSSNNVDVERSDGEQYYVVLPTTGETIITHSSNVNGINSKSVSNGSLNNNKSSRPHRDEKRRASHNEVERRRRDKINNCMVRLTNLMMGSNYDKGKCDKSKGLVLSMACDHITDLRAANASLAESLRSFEMKMDNGERESQLVAILKEQVNQITKQNQQLIEQLISAGIDPNL